MKTEEELKNLQMLLRQLRCMWSFGTWRDAQVPRIWSEELRTLSEELRTLKEGLEQLEELAVRAYLRKLVVRALKKRHLACAQASLPWISSALQRPQQQQQQ